MNKQSVIEKLLTHRDDSKSTIFLYPLLQLPKSIQPVHTYLLIEGVKLITRPLICLFHTDTLKESDRLVLTANKFFDFSIKDKEYEFFFFEFSRIADIYDSILKGEYTKISLNAKLILYKEEHPISEIAINPEAYYEDYAYELETTVALLQEKVELIEPPRLEKECITIGKEALIQLQDFI